MPELSGLETIYMTVLWSGVLYGAAILAGRTRFFIAGGRHRYRVLIFLLPMFTPLASQLIFSDNTSFSPMAHVQHELLDLGYAWQQMIRAGAWLRGPLIVLASCLVPLVVAVSLAALRYYCQNALLARLTAVSEGVPHYVADMVTRCSLRLSIPAPRCVLVPHDAPKAFVAGLFKPTFFLSAGLLRRLSPPELKAVLIHELAHIARKDYLFSWMGVFLRDLMFYNPIGYIALRRLRHENELACDEMAADFTGQPLTLASSLTKVWASGAQGGSLRREPLLSAFVEFGESYSLDRVRSLTGSEVLVPAPRRSKPCPAAPIALAGTALAVLVSVTYPLITSGSCNLGF